MDVASFALSETQRIYQRAGLTVLFPVDSPRSEPEYLPSPLWDAVRQRIPLSPLAVITYPELGEDFTSASDPARSQLFRSLLLDLAMPKGTFAFLPYSFPDSPSKTSDIHCFLQTLTSLSPRYLLVFGEMPQLPYELYPELQPLLLADRRLSFPSPSNIIKGMPDLKSRIVSQLRTCLAQHPSDDS